MANSADSPSTAASFPMLFRRYQLTRELGRGGMGVVYLAHDTALDVQVAIKIVPEVVARDTDAVTDLRKEVLRGMALAHSGIVRTHNFERDESGAAIVMEYVDGGTLAHVKSIQPDSCFDPEQILPWLEQLCVVLDYAHHEARIVHRDLKPRNVMLTANGRIKVADFGIAAILSDSISRHSMEGVVAGTLSYMSPQQAEGKRPRSGDDIHAAGATIYELLTGKPPFFRGGQGAIYQQVIHVVPPSMTERREEFGITGRREIPGSWEMAVAACLAKDEDQRPQTGSELIALLRDAKRPALTRPAVMLPAPGVVTRIPDAKLLRGDSAEAQPGYATQAPPASVPPPPAAFSPAVHKRRQSYAAWVLAIICVTGVGGWLGYDREKGERKANAGGNSSSEYSTQPPRTASAPVSFAPPNPAPVAVSATPVLNGAASTRVPATPAPAPPPPQRPRVSVEYKGQITSSANSQSAVMLTVTFDDSGEPSGTMIQSTPVGDTVVKFSGTWEGQVLKAKTGTVIRKPARIRWEPETFTLAMSLEGARLLYECTAAGETYRAELKSPAL